MLKLSNKYQEHALTLLPDFIYQHVEYTPAILKKHGQLQASCPTGYSYHDKIW
jgi:hypothetical protein